jgi:hypothetical protein
VTAGRGFATALAERIARLRRLFAPPADAGGGITGTCRLCGKHRHDLNHDDVCEPCFLSVW